LRTSFDTDIAILKLFPGIDKRTVDAIINAEGLKAIILETYGSGNAPSSDWFIESLKGAIERGSYFGQYFPMSRRYRGTRENMRPVNRWLK
jgi:L-asparaginase/Glu-tRNA(Gln) amidotransferase subunit D